MRAGTGIALKASWDLLPELAEGTIVQCLEPFWCDQIGLLPLRQPEHTRRLAFEPPMDFIWNAFGLGNRLQIQSTWPYNRLIG